MVSTELPILLFLTLVRRCEAKYDVAISGRAYDVYGSGPSLIALRTFEVSMILLSLHALRNHRCRYRHRWRRLGLCRKSSDR